MYLKKIEINGFKSFANKTVLTLEKGITAVVGPNGSGKSNIADAIKWALGEQSVKSLRGKKSEDIIFAGSEKRAQVSAASVFLMFDNKDKKIPLGFEEVVIGRKIFRDGTGQYSINGSKARLFDIIENLAASGIGRGGHTVINQGMADKILASTPVERRITIEDATGIKQFRIKRDQAEKKLEATSQNMERISGLLAEIEPRLKFLRRQAEKAQKKNEIEKLLKDNQKKYYSAKITDLKKGKTGFDERKKILNTKIEEEKNKLFELEELLKKESEKESFGTEKIIEARKILQNLSLNRRSAEKEIVILEGRIDLLKRQIADKNKRIKIAEYEEAANSNGVKKINAKSDEKILVSKLDLKNLINILNFSNQNSLDSLKNALSRVLNFLKKIVEIEKEHIQKDISEISRASKQIETLKKEIADDNQNIKNLEAELQDKKRYFDKIEEEIKEFETEIIKINQEDQKRRGKFFEIEREVRKRRDDLDKLKNTENAIRIEESRVVVRLEDLEKEIRSEIGEDFNFESTKSNQDDILATELSIRKLKAQLEQIGGIDDLTIQEYKETENRFVTMHKEYKDMDDARNNLKNLILDLDNKMEEKFSKSFKLIAEEFEKYFKMIFGGGSAKIFYSKLKEENQEEYSSGENGLSNNFGVEITAIPPGKKTKSLAMLSGGERALTSIALLFAIISSNPPPFCVLDEVDAALDEANSSRIGRVFKELSEKTQFIIITHNREIMNQSTALYGTTMQKDGVSQLLSVKLKP